MFDTDGSGAISASEFRDVCLAVGMTPTDDELKVQPKKSPTVWGLAKESQLPKNPHHLELLRISRVASVSNEWNQWSVLAMPTVSLITHVIK